MGTGQGELSLSVIELNRGPSICIMADSAIGAEIIADMVGILNGVVVIGMAGETGGRRIVVTVGMAGDTR